MDKQRYNRLAQAKHRSSKRSYKTELENLQILLAMEATQLSDGQVSQELALDRVALRMMREGAIAEGIRVFEKMAPSTFFSGHRER